MNKAKQEHSPLMQQYHKIKADYSDTLLFFQVGDFYELFFEDAKKAASFLGIALTARGKNKGEPIPLCGVPVHAKDHYVIKLVKGGFKVAVCGQLEPPRPGTVVKRGVIEVLSPGTLTDEKLLDEKSPSYLLSFFPTENAWGVLFGELMTGQLFGTVIPDLSERLLESELARFFPDEVLIPQNKLGKSFAPLFKRLGYFTTPIFDEQEDVDKGRELDAWMSEQFSPSTQDAVRKSDPLYWALYYFYAYLKRNQANALSQFNQFHLYQSDDFLLLDAATQRNLELVKNNQDGGRSHTLYSVLDGAATAMGSRMIKKWIGRPLVKKEAIEQRYDVVQLFSEQIPLAQQLSQLLKTVGDIERVVGRIALRRAAVHDFSTLSSALAQVPFLIGLLTPFTDKSLVLVICRHLDNFSVLKQLLDSAFYTMPHEQWIIKKGFDQKLDHLRELIGMSNQDILKLEADEQKATGIQSLKIRYNRVHGYYIEVTKANQNLVPDHYIRQQTLVGRQRYTTPPLQRLQAEIIQARTGIEQVETRVFEQVKNEIQQYVPALRKLAHALAHIDALLGFATVAYDYGYTRPAFNSTQDIFITKGRHPMVEAYGDNPFIPNDTHLTDQQSLWIITGPNMGGKSTYLRQVALISIMAQCGAFVPAERAQLALLDRVFTRIGSGDNLAGGKSTFLVEMEETATICTQATKKSLVILDEVGRGTSTFDGLAIAQAVVEYIYTQIGARCLFATHYHELTQLEKEHEGITSYFAASKKTPGGIIFLYQMVRGIADGSFGVEVAKLAKLPGGVIDRATAILEQLTEQESLKVMPHKSSNPHSFKAAQQTDEATQKLNHYTQLFNQLKAVDCDNLSPKQAFDLVWELKKQI